MVKLYQIIMQFRIEFLNINLPEKMKKIGNSTLYVQLFEDKSTTPFFKPEMLTFVKPAPIHSYEGPAFLQSA